MLENIISISSIIDHDISRNDAYFCDGKFVHSSEGMQNIATTLVVVSSSSHASDGDDGDGDVDDDDNNLLTFN